MNGHLKPHASRLELLIGAQICSSLSVISVDDTPVLLWLSQNSKSSSTSLSLFLFLRPCVCSQSCPDLCNPMDCSPQASLSMGFSRQEYWSGLPLPPPGDLPDLGIETASLKSPALAGGFFTTNAYLHLIHQQILLADFTGSL